jgi:hypothetical protein
MGETQVVNPQLQINESVQTITPGLTANSHSQESAIIIDDERFDANHASNPGSRNGFTIPSDMHQAAAMLSPEEQKARKLRDEIAHESMELRRLELLAAQLPKYSKSTRTDSSIFSSHSGSTYDKASWIGSSQVIADLQAKVDALKRQLVEQTEIAKDEFERKEALRKRCDILDSTVDSLKHQNANLSQLLNRRERRIATVEDELVTKSRRIAALEQVQIAYSDSHKEYETKLLRSQGERDRLEASYKALLQSSKDMKCKYQDEVKVITDKISALQHQSQADLKRIGSLDERLNEQTADYARAVQLQKEMTQLRESHLGKINQMFGDLKNVVSLSDHDLTEKVQAVLTLVAELKRKSSENDTAMNDTAM